MNTWFTDEVEYQKHREMLSVHSVESMEMVHVKNPGRYEDDDSQHTAFGIVTVDNGKYVLWQGHLANRKTFLYDNLDALMEDGWVVD